MKILIDQAVIDQALEALEFDGFTPQDATHRSYHAKAITALRQAKANAALDRMAENERELGIQMGAESKPVAAHQALEALGELEASARGDEPFNHFAAPLVRQFIEQTLYTSPPQRHPLTDEEINEFFQGMEPNNGFWLSFARAIEAAHGIKGEA